MDSSNDALAERHARFFESLAEKDTIAGWGYNPWGQPDGSEQQLTALAERLIVRVCDAMRAKGYAPVTGVEVNAQPQGVDSEKLTKDLIETVSFYQQWSVQQNPEFQAAIAALHGIPLLKDHASANAFPPLRLKDKKQEIEQAFEPITQGHVSEKFLKAFRVALQPLSLAKILNPAYEEAIGELLQIAEKLAIQKDPEAPFPTGWDTHFASRIYRDGNEIEITTPPQTPLETIRDVNKIKQRLYEASFDYEDHYAQLFAGTPQERGMYQAEAPRHVFSALLRHFVDKPFNIHFATKTANLGEHVSVSLQKLEPGQTGYEALEALATNPQAGVQAMRQFASNNLLGNAVIDELIYHGLRLGLANDTLLTLANNFTLKYGATHSNSEFAITQNTKHMKQDAEETLKAANRRQEVRTFHNATSNLSLSMLAILANIYAVTEVIDTNPILQQGVKLKGLETTYKNILRDAFTDKGRANEQFGFKADSHLPQSKSSAIKRFSDDSITLKVLEHIARDYAKDDAERAEWLQEIEQFKGMVVHQAKARLPDSRQAPQAALSGRMEYGDYVVENPVYLGRPLDAISREADGVATRGYN